MTRKLLFRPALVHFAFSFSLCCVAWACFQASAPAAVIIYEPFDYTTGPIEGNVNPVTGTPWNHAQTAGSNSSPVHSVVSGSLVSPPGFPAASGNSADMVNTDNHYFMRMDLPNTYGTNTTLYYSALINVPSTAGLNTPNTNLNANNNLIIGFNNSQGQQDTNVTVWGAELVIRLGSVADTYNLGIRATGTPGGTNPGHTYWTPDIAADPNVTHLAVVRFIQGNDASVGTDDYNDLWINPSALSYGAPEGSEPAPDNPDQVQGSIQQSNPGLNYAASLLIGAGISNTATIQNPDHVYLDEIRVGTTWADVTTETILVPEPASIGLLGIAALGLLARRRREV